MDYLDIFLIAFGIVTYLIFSGWIARLLGPEGDGEGALIGWFAFHIVVGTVAIASYGLYKEHGFYPFIAGAVALAGIVTPFIVWYFIYGLVTKIKSRKTIKTPAIKELPERGAYIDVEYSKPIHRTVAELIED